MADLISILFFLGAGAVAGRGVYLANQVAYDTLQRGVHSARLRYR